MGRDLLRVSAALALVALAGGFDLTAQAQSTPKGQPAPAASTAAKPAPVSADPAATSASYGDWVVRCQRVGEGDQAKRLCEVAQTIQVQGQQGPIAQIAFGHLATTDPLRFTVALPPNVTIPGSVTIGLGDKDPSPMPLTLRRCVPGACFADAVPNADELKAFRGATDPGRIVFKDAGGRDIALPLSFRGFAQAMDALSKA